LFAQRGPNATTMRDIAERSGVNYGLVHRHFGTKRTLLAAVLDHLSDEVAALTDEGPTSQALAAAVERNWRVLARSILDGYPVGQLQQHFPYVAGLVERARPYQPNELAARLAAGNAIALELGWRLFDSFLRSAAGLEHASPTTLRDAINTTTSLILDTTTVHLGTA
jgi:AcrR family transcriptional regulator